MQSSDVQIRSSHRTCSVFDPSGQLVGKIRFQRDRNFRVWRVKYLSQGLPIHSGDTPAEIKQALSELGYTWKWGEIRHYYGYQSL